MASSRYKLYNNQWAKNNRNSHVNFTPEKAAVTTSLTWPPKWRKVVHKIDVYRNTNEDTTTYRVYPINPEWRTA